MQPVKTALAIRIIHEGIHHGVIHVMARRASTSDEVGGKTVFSFRIRFGH